MKANEVKKSGIELIAEERQRQIEVEGYSKEHDSQHKASEFIEAANSYTESAVSSVMKSPVVQVIDVFALICVLPAILL
jgi:hypothetical protein